MGEEGYVLEPVDELTPIEVFNRRWAQRILQTALDRQRQEYGTRGEAALFEILGTDSWSVAAVQLRGNETNVIVVTATTASGFLVNGGATTFSDTLAVQSLPITVRLNRQGSILTLSWIGGTGPYRVQKATNLKLADWQDYLTNAQFPLTLDVADRLGFYRVVEP